MNTILPSGLLCTHWGNKPAALWGGGTVFIQQVVTLSPEAPHQQNRHNNQTKLV